jgi:hypothetical protein
MPPAAYDDECVYGAVRARSHYRFRKRGTDYLRESGVKRMSSNATRRRDRTPGEVPMPYRNPESCKSMPDFETDSNQARPGGEVMYAPPCIFP